MSSEVIQTHNKNPNLLLPVNYGRLLEIAMAHVPKPEYENIRVWYHIKRDKNFDLEKIKSDFGASEVSIVLSHYLNGKNFFTKHFEFEQYDLSIKNPRKLPGVIENNKGSYPLVALKVFSIGNIEYAGFLLESMQAVVKPQYFNELEASGFQCWPSGEAVNPFIEQGPFRNVFSLEEEFGSINKEWIDACMRGEGGPLIINK